VEPEERQQSGGAGEPGMCPLRPGGDRLDQGPLLLSVGFAASPDTIRGVAPRGHGARETGRGPAVTRPQGQLLNHST